MNPAARRSTVFTWSLVGHWAFRRYVATAEAGPFRHLPGLFLAVDDDPRRHHNHGRAGFPGRRPRSLNSRFRYGTWLITGGPTRSGSGPASSARRAAPSRRPHGHRRRATISEKLGCWKNCVNGTGWPWLPPSNTGVMNVLIGNSGTVALARGRQARAEVQPDEPSVGADDRLQPSRSPRPADRCRVHPWPIGKACVDRQVHELPADVVHTSCWS